MFNSKFKGLLSLALCLALYNFAYAADFTPSTSWWNDTANLRSGIQQMQSQITDARNKQVENTAKLQNNVREIREVLTHLYNAIVSYLTNPINGSKTGNQAPAALPPMSPWLKANPWQNTEQNPYSHQGSPNTPTNQPNNIYVNPAPTPNQQPQQPGGAVNIFK